MNAEIKQRIQQLVHEFYWQQDINCARTMLCCLAELFDVELEPQVLQAAAGLHGAGGYRAQCGLVEGSIMFIGIYSHRQQQAEAAAGRCYCFAEKFEQEFSSLRCFDLRPGGFRADDEPHKCERLTCAAVGFTYEFVCSLTA